MEDSAPLEYKPPSHRRMEICPACGAAMEQFGEPIWSISELATDLARMSDEIADSGTSLLWYSRCPSGCHQCFGCRQWFEADAKCSDCTPCPECGAAMLLTTDDDD